jgi:NADH:ubiquinone oxidoreductase subunit F (NADH-binding)
VVVGNAAEGEPASSKDAALLWLAPHLVLDGLQAAAEAVGARSACLYLSSGHPRGGQDLAGQLRKALASRAAAGTGRIGVERAPWRSLVPQRRHARRARIDALHRARR